MWSVKETNIPNFSKLIIFPYKKKNERKKLSFWKNHWKVKVRSYYDRYFNWLQSFQAGIVVRGPSAVYFGLLVVWLIHKITQQQDTVQFINH